MIIYIKLILQVSISFSKYLLSVVYVLNIILRGRDKSGNKVDKHSCPGGARASPIAQLVKNLPGCRRPGFDSWVGKNHWRRDRLPTPVFLGFPCGSAGIESTCNAEDFGLISGLRRSPGEGKSYPLQGSGLENSMDCIVHGVAKSQT